MEFLSALTAGSVFALACNLDTVLASVGQGARGEELSLSKALAVAGLTTMVTFLSLLLGAVGPPFFRKAWPGGWVGWPSRPWVFGTYWTPFGERGRPRPKEKAGWHSAPPWR